MREHDEGTRVLVGRESDRIAPLVVFGELAIILMASAVFVFKVVGSIWISNKLGFTDIKMNKV